MRVERDPNGVYASVDSNTMPGDALGRDLREARDERLHRDAAHRMTDEHRVAQVETFEHGLDVAAEVLERVALVAEHRLTVTAVVERDRRGSPPSGSSSSWWNHVRTDSVTPCESTIGGSSSLPRSTT